jgi:glycyl-tRNA synthetase beta chain
MNTDADPEGLVRHGNERVLRAVQRRAFLLGSGSEEEAGGSPGPDLKKVTFQAKLGSYYEKTHARRELVALCSVRRRWSAPLCCQSATSPPTW